MRKAALDYAETLLASDPSGWFTLKEYLLRIAATDPDFLMRHYPDQRRLLERWLQSLNLRWLADRPSPYPALRAQALARLSGRLGAHPDAHTPASDFARRLYQRLQQTQPSVVD
ncbi:MAG: hypothetical protein D6717_12600 [Gammaproteobacteria bacterium]|nr:MAG: hypothetical protein D6717_12600 [Gammaproteobacteria bacterium]